MPRRRRAASSLSLRELSLPRLCTNTPSFLRHSRSSNALEDQLKESQSLLSLCNRPSSPSLSPTSPSSTILEPATSLEYKTQVHYQLHQQQQSPCSKNFWLLHSALPSPNLTRIIHSMQSPSPTSPRSSTPTISPLSLTYSYPHHSSMQSSSIAPLSLPLAQLEMGASIRPLSKHHFEWCLACCRTVLDEVELASIPSSAADAHETLQSLVDIYANAEVHATSSSSLSFASPCFPCSPTCTLKLHSTPRLPKYNSSLSRLRQSSSNSSLASHCSQLVSPASIDSHTVHLPPNGTTSSQCTCYHPSTPSTSSTSFFAASAQAAATLAFTLLCALSKEQLLDLIFLIYSKAPRNLAVAAPYWIGVNHVRANDDEEGDSDNSNDGDDSYSGVIDGDLDTSTREKDEAAWSPKSLISCPSLSLPPWRQQALDDDHLPVSIDSADPEVSSDRETSRKETKVPIGSPMLLKRRADAAMLSAILVVPGSLMGPSGTPNGPKIPDEPVPPLPTPGSSPVERPRKAKYISHRGKDHDAQECCEPGSPPCYDYKTSYWQYQTRRRTRQRVKSKGTHARSNQPPPSGHSYRLSIESSKLSPETEAAATAVAIQERNKALEQEMLQEASKMMNEVQIAVTSLDSHGRVSPVVAGSANYATNGQAVHVWPTQRIYTICSTPTSNDGPVNERTKYDPRLDSSISPTFGIPISGSTETARTTIAPFSGANTPPRSSSLQGLSTKEQRISFQPSVISASILRSKNRAPPPLPIETSGLSVLPKALAATALSPSTATSSLITDGSVDANTTGSKSLAQKAAETSHKLWESSMTVLRRKVNSPSNASKSDTAIGSTSDTLTSVEIPSVIVSTPLSLPSYESEANVSSNDPRIFAAAMKTPRSQHLHSRSQDFSIEVKTRLQERIPFHHHQLAINLPGRGGPSFLPSIAIADSTQGTRFKPKGKKVAASPTPSQGFPEDGLRSSAFMIPDDYLSMIPPSNAIPWFSPTPLPAVGSFEGNSLKSQPQSVSPLASLAIAEAALGASVSSLDKSTPSTKVQGRKKSIHEKLFGPKRDKAPTSPSPSPLPTASVDTSQCYTKNNFHDRNIVSPRAFNDMQINSPQESRLQPTKSWSPDDPSISMVSSTGLLTASNLSTVHANSNRSSRVIEDYNGRPVLWSTTVSVVSSTSTSSSLATKATSSSLPGTKCAHHHQHHRTTTAVHNPDCRWHGSTPVQTGTGHGITAPSIDKDRTLRWDNYTNGKIPEAEKSSATSWTRSRDTAAVTVESRADLDQVDIEKRRKEDEYVARVMGQWQSWAHTCGSTTSPLPHSKATDTSAARLVSKATRVLPSISSSATRGNGANITQRVKLGVH